MIFGHFAKIPTDGAPYALFAGSAVVLWTYFAEAVRRSANGLVAEAESSARSLPAVGHPAPPL